MTLEEKQKVLNDMLVLAETVGEYSPEGNGDSIEDLNEEEIGTLGDQLVEKLKRPRHDIPQI